MARSRKAASSHHPKARIVAIALPLLGCLVPAAAVASVSVMDSALAGLGLLDAVEVPTLGEWGMLFATLSLLAAGTSVIVRRRRR